MCTLSVDPRSADSIQSAFYGWGVKMIAGGLFRLIIFLKVQKSFYNSKILVPPQLSHLQAFQKTWPPTLRSRWLRFSVDISRVTTTFISLLRPKVKTLPHYRLANLPFKIIFLPLGQYRGALHLYWCNCDMRWTCASKQWSFNKCSLCGWSHNEPNGTTAPSGEQRLSWCNSTEIKSVNISQIFTTPWIIKLLGQSSPGSWQGASVLGNCGLSSWKLLGGSCRSSSHQ